MSGSRQEVRFHSCSAGALQDLLELREPPFARAFHPFKQLEYIKRYVEKLNCRSVAIERHYIDRDYMEDHSVFYSRNFYPYENSCKRIHFFSLEVEDLKQRLRQLLQIATRDGKLAFRRECDCFSQESYIGFSVIKPLHGCPVGRTVLRCYPEEDEEYSRIFGCTRLYRSHFMGVELAVRGLAFQQQDTGVSACATTALWSAIQKIRDFEEIAMPTPAQITKLASQFSLPFGIDRDAAKITNALFAPEKAV